MSFSEILLNNNIYYLTHFTNIENLESILINGIKSVQYMKTHKIKYSHNDEYRFDNQLNLISISLNEINYKMLYKRQKKNNNQINSWVILKLKTCLLDDKKDKVYFCKENAASTEINVMLKRNSKELNTNDALTKMLRSSDNQKEILVEETIETYYIESIIVENIRDYDLVKFILKKSKKNIPVICKKDMFVNKMWR